MKVMARELIKVHYKEAICPDIDFCHNSADRNEIISRNVKKLIKGSLFIQGPRDAQVSASGYIRALTPTCDNRVERKISDTAPLSIF